MLKYENLKNKAREVLAATGLKAEEYEGLLVRFRLEYATTYAVDKTQEGTARKRRFGGGNTGVLFGDEDKLLFMLV